MNRVNSTDFSSLSTDLNRVFLSLILSTLNRSLKQATRTTFINSTIANNIRVKNRVMKMSSRSITRNTITLGKRMLFMIIRIRSNFHNVNRTPSSNGTSLSQITRTVISLLTKIIRNRSLRKSLFTVLLPTHLRSERLLSITTLTRRYTHN